MILKLPIHSILETPVEEITNEFRITEGRVLATKKKLGIKFCGPPTF